MSTGVLSKCQPVYMRKYGRILVAPAVVLLLVFSLAPLFATLYFSFIDYRLLFPENTGFVGFTNYRNLFASPNFVPALSNTVFLIAFVLSITVAAGLGLALLVERANLPIIRYANVMH